MSKGKKIIISIVAMMLLIVIAGLLWWFIPYIHPIKREDKHVGYRYWLEKDEIHLIRYIGEDKIVHVPERMKGRKVVIEYACFSNTDIEEAYVSPNVEIPMGAFSPCKNLRKFQGGSNTVIYSYTFFRDENLEEVLFTNEIEKVEERAFAVCKKLELVDFIEKTKCIDNEAFWDTAVEKLPVMNHLEHVGSDVFSDTPWEEKQQGDFVILGNTLQLYKGAGAIVRIPQGITAIRRAFYYKEKKKYPAQVKEIYIPDSVQVLLASAFYYQKDLTVYIPDSVIHIGDEYGEDAYYSIGNNVKIVTTSGSYAEEYAQKYGIEYEIVDGWDKAAGNTEDMEEKAKTDISWVNTYVELLNGSDYEHGNYALAYVDEDDIPELIRDYNYSYQISTCFVGEPVLCYEEMGYGTHSRMYYFLPEQNNIVSTCTGDGGIGDFEEYLTLENGELKYEMSIGKIPQFDNQGNLLYDESGNYVYSYVKEYEGVEEEITEEMWKSMTMANEDYVYFDEIEYFTKEEMLEKLLNYRL